MTLRPTYSRRKREAARAGVDVYEYDDLPSRVRVQIVHIISAVTGPSRESGYDAPAKPMYDYMLRHFRKELGVFYLPPTTTASYADPHKELFDWFLRTQELDEAIDFVEMACDIMLSFVKPSPHIFRDYATQIARRRYCRN